MSQNTLSNLPIPSPFSIGNDQGQSKPQLNGNQLNQIEEEDEEDDEDSSDEVIKTDSTFIEMELKEKEQKKLFEEMMGIKGNTEEGEEDSLLTDDNIDESNEEEDDTDGNEQEG